MLMLGLRTQEAAFLRRDDVFGLDNVPAGAAVSPTRRGLQKLDLLARVPPGEVVRNSTRNDDASDKSQEDGRVLNH
ncbi:MAG TPA: hypothetical protein VKG25_16235 [Bryobacteraceae bacterium]|nr:hypothetical protein [Bryobacteraceae bacterium]